MQIYHSLVIYSFVKLFSDAVESFLHLEWVSVLRGKINNKKILFSPGLTMHASILAYMFSLVEEGKISVTLNSTAPVNNQVHVQEYVANLLKTAFPHLQE